MLKQYLPNKTNKFQRLIVLFVVLIVTGVGTYLLTASHAATSYASITADKGVISCGASVISDPTASDASKVQFGACGTSGTTYYVSPNGSDSNSGTSSSSPWKTVSKVNGFCPQPGDSVLFQGGQTFSAVLTPNCSGASGNPVTYGSYGSGRPILQAVDLPGANHDLTFNNLELTSDNQLFLACGSCNQAHYNITLKNSYLHNTSALGIHSEPADHDWLIQDNIVQHTGDSGILTEYSSNIIVTGNIISFTGERNAQIGYGTHSIYAKGPNLTISYNDFSQDTGGQAISVRAHGQHIYGNTIHDTPSAFEFFDYDTGAPPQGTTYIYNNRAWNISGDSFYYSNQTDPQGKAPSVSFVIANNTFVVNGGEQVNLSAVPSGASVTLANNIFTGSYGSTYRGCATCTEHNNDWFGGSSNIPSGANDLFVNPNLSAAPAFSLPAGSPLIDKGTTNVPGLTYSSGTDGQPLHYAGSAPDMGATELH